MFFFYFFFGDEIPEGSTPIMFDPKSTKKIW